MMLSFLPLLGLLTLGRAKSTVTLLWGSAVASAIASTLTPHHDSKDDVAGVWTTQADGGDESNGDQSPVVGIAKSGAGQGPTRNALKRARSNNSAKDVDQASSKEKKLAFNGPYALDVQSTASLLVRSAPPPDDVREQRGSRSLRRPRSHRLPAVSSQDEDRVGQIPDHTSSLNLAAFQTSSSEALPHDDGGREARLSAEKRPRPSYPKRDLERYPVALHSRSHRRIVQEEKHGRDASSSEGVAEDDGGTVHQVKSEVATRGKGELADHVVDQSARTLARQPRGPLTAKIVRRLRGRGRHILQTTEQMRAEPAVGDGEAVEPERAGQDPAEAAAAVERLLQPDEGADAETVVDSIVDPIEDPVTDAINSTIAESIAATTATPTMLSSTKPVTGPVLEAAAVTREDPYSLPRDSEAKSIVAPLVQRNGGQSTAAAAERRPESGTAPHLQTGELSTHGPVHEADGAPVDESILQVSAQPLLQRYEVYNSISTKSVQELAPAQLPPALKRKPIELKGSKCLDILAWTPPRVSPVVVLQVVSKEFIAVEKNFILFMEKNSQLTREHLLLLCVDKESANVFDQLGIRCARMKGVKGHQMFYMIRVKVLGCLLEAGHDVLLSDSDALWLKDPLQDMKEHGIDRNDMLIQRGKFPVALGQKWGVTMCMGFSLFRGGTEGMAGFQKVFQAVTRDRGDDQVAVNYAASRLGIEWDQEPSRSDMRYYTSTLVGIGTLKNLPVNFSVALLPHNRYTRDCEQTPVTADTVIAHCLTSKDVSDKLLWMKNENLWLLDEETLLPRPVRRQSSPLSSPPTSSPVTPVSATSYALDGGDPSAAGMATTDSGGTAALNASSASAVGNDNVLAEKDVVAPLVVGTEMGGTEILPP